MAGLSIFRFLIARNASPRPILRKNLRLATRGDQWAFLILVQHYLDLVVEYFCLSGAAGPTTVSHKAQTVFFTVWKRLPYTTRLSDFERLLALVLLQETAPVTVVPNSPLKQKLDQLEPEDRFLLVAFEMEQWHRHWTSLACRLKPKALDQHLLELRCRLCNLNRQELDKKTLHCLSSISKDLNEGLPLKRRAALCKQLDHMPQIRDFKAEWLNLRCELIEWRQQIRFNRENREAFTKSLMARLAPSQMLHPLWLQRLFNRIHFGSFPDLKVS